MASITEFTKAIDPQVQAIFTTVLGERSMADSIVNPVPPEAYTLTIGSQTGVGSTPTKLEGEDATPANPRQGPTQTATHVVYSHLLQITRELSMWDRFASVNKMVHSMAQGTMYARESSVANIFARAFNNAYTGADALELVSRVHPLYGANGGTTPNEIATTATALSPDTLEEIRLIFQNCVNDNGQIIQQRPRFLLTGLTLGTRARTYLGSPLMPESANNDINEIARGMMPLEWDLITSPINYFLLGDKSAHDISRSVKQTPTPRGPFVQFRSENIEYAIAFEEIVFFVGWRGVAGATGA